MLNSASQAAPVWQAEQVPGPDQPCWQEQVPLAASNCWVAEQSAAGRVAVGAVLSKGQLPRQQSGDKLGQKPELPSITPPCRLLQRKNKPSALSPPLPPGHTNHKHARPTLQRAAGGCFRCWRRRRGGRHRADRCAAELSREAGAEARWHIARRASPAALASAGGSAVRCGRAAAVGAAVGRAPKRCLRKGGRGMASLHDVDRTEPNSPCKAVGQASDCIQWLVCKQPSPPVRQSVQKSGRARRPHSQALRSGTRNA